LVARVYVTQRLTASRSRYRSRIDIETGSSGIDSDFAGAQEPSG
jgi:hypothetical protein